MPLNGSGSYSAPANSWNPAVTNTTINSTDWAALLADLTTALSTALYKDGQQTPTANLPMGGFKLTGLAAGSTNGDSVRYEQVIGAFLPIGGGTLTGSLLFTDATYDIGASGATRPRDLFLSRNAAIGGTLGVTGAATLASVTGGVIAAQSDQETATSLTTVVTPGRQHFHPSAAKAWCQVTQSAGTYTLQAGSFGVSSINKTGTGLVTVTFSVTFSATTAMAPQATSVVAQNAFFNVVPASTTTVTMDIRRTSTEANIDAGFSLVVYGDLA